MNLAGCAEEIQHRLIHLFSRDEHGRRAVNGGNPKLNRDPHFRDYVHFYEFFHGNDGRGLGASHQTGWTGLVAWMIMQTGEYCRLPKTPRSESFSLVMARSRIDADGQHREVLLSITLMNTSTHLVNSVMDPYTLLDQLTLTGTSHMFSTNCADN
jgi:hypothetical protein